MSKTKKIITVIVLTLLLTVSFVPTLSISAEELNKEFYISLHGYMWKTGGVQTNITNSSEPGWFNGGKEIKGNSNSQLFIDNDLWFMNDLEIRERYNGVMFRANEPVTFSIENIYSHFKIADTVYPLKKMDEISFWVEYSDGTVGYERKLTTKVYRYNAKMQTHGYFFEPITFPKDVVAVRFQEWFKPIDQFGLSGYRSVEFALGVDGVKMSATVQSQDAKDIINNQNENADKITQNQDQNTQDIIDNQNNLYDKEKEETNNSANDSVDGLTSAIPVETDGLLNAFGNLKNSMLHTSTECKIDFPAIKTPAILGVIPEYTLYEGGQVDFEQSVELLPEALLLLVRALLTIALILCCFKELYDTISYVLTLRKGGGE